MKKFASVLLAVLVAFSMFSFVVSAATSITATADKTTVNAGDEVVVTVAVPKDSHIGVLTVDAKYNTEAFEVVSLVANPGPVDEETGCTAFGTAITNKAYAEGVARYTTAHPYEIVEAGTLFTLKLNAVKSMDSEITFVINEVCDAEGNDIKDSVTINTVVIKGAAVDEPSTDEPSTDEPSTDEPSTDKPSEDEDPCADGHTWSTWAVEKVAECKKDGLKGRNCTVCGEKETEVIPATGKCAYKWVVTKEATATEYGEKQLKCTMCGHVKETQKLAVKNDSADSLDKPAIPNTDAIA